LGQLVKRGGVFGTLCGRTLVFHNLLKCSNKDKQQGVWFQTHKPRIVQPADLFMQLKKIAFDVDLYTFVHKNHFL
jgi:hypothetical protein